MRIKDKVLISIAVVGLIVWAILMFLVRIELIKWVLS